MVNQMVLSTEIEWIGYEDSKNMLQVEFIAGGVYQYYQVPRFVYEEFLEAESHCRFFEEHIKGNYEYRQVK